MDTHRSDGVFADGAPHPVLCKRFSFRRSIRGDAAAEENAGVKPMSPTITPSEQMHHRADE